MRIDSAFEDDDASALWDLAGRAAQARVDAEDQAVELRVAQPAELAFEVGGGPEAYDFEQPTPSGIASLRTMKAPSKGTSAGMT